MLEKRHGYQILNADALTYAADEENLSDVAQSPDYCFFKLDIRDKKAVSLLFGEYTIDAVINFAAQSHVDRSIDDPGEFVSTNVMGTQILLEAALRSWKLSPEDNRDRRFRDGVKFIQISTDEVYGEISAGLAAEDSPLHPNNPYAATKAGADMLVGAYYHTYGLPAIITRCCNNYGPRQHPEKLIPMTITRCVREEKIPVYGNGRQRRNWIHVRDHCAAIEAVLYRGTAGEVYNIGGDSERENLDIVRHIVRLTGSSEDLISFVGDRPGHDKRYAIDSGKISRALGWRPEISLERGMRETIDWYTRKASRPAGNES